MLKTWTLSTAQKLAFRNLADLPSSLVSDMCGFDGNADIYGLGTRLGYYLQLIAAELAIHYVPDEAFGMHDISYCFRLSIFIALLQNTLSHSPSDVYAAETWLVLFLCLNGTSLSQKFTPRRVNPLRIFVVAILNAAILGYSLWFLYLGMDQMAHPPCSRSAVVFFLKVDLYRSFRTILKVVFTAVATVLSTVLVVLFLKFVAAVRTHGPQQALKKVTARFGNGADATESDPGEANAQAPEVPAAINPKNTTLARCKSMFMILFLVSSTEFSIRWNHITNVTTAMSWSTGQLVPLFVAGCGLAKVVYKMAGMHPEGTVDPHPESRFLSPWTEQTRYDALA